MIEQIFGANYRTLLTSLGSALFGLLTVLAALPYSLGDVATIIAPEWKAKVFTISAIATAILKILNGFVQKDKNVVGGTVVQNAKGHVDHTATVQLEHRMKGKEL